MIARLGIHTADERLADFLKAVSVGLPQGFVGGTREDLAFAFTFWTALSMTDGDFSQMERRAIERLKEHFDNERALKRNSELFVARQVAALMSDYDRTLSGMAGVREPSLLGEDFTARAEEMLRNVVAIRD